MKNKLNERIKNFNITILISLFLLLSCGSGQLQAGKDGEAATGGSSLSAVLMEVGRSAENAFYSFLELLSDILGFTAKSTTKKDEVGKYFSELGVKLGEVSKELEEVAKKSEGEGAKDGSIAVVIRAAVEAAKTTLSTLKGHLASLKDIGDAKMVGDSNTVQGVGTTPDEPKLKAAYDAFKGILEESVNAGVVKLETGITTLTAPGGADNKDGAKILSTNGNPDAGDVAKAAAILATVSGKEILASIVASQENDAALNAAAKAETTAMSFAKGGQAAHLAGETNAKAAAVAGGIALRSLVKTGKLASGAADNATGGGKEVQGVGITAVNKLLVAVEDIIKKTVKNVLKAAKEKIDEARAPKSAGQQ
ncbi:variable large family protein [Borrelia turicatae]|uniref:Variable large protein n=1 Tax=Borrelia turicatae (strain 91E135) TaxID=314724 RepID=A0ABF7R008_BORT9|nr:variable large family protein [Borrelia turicatae]ASJ27699.1 VlpA8 [Borrelia turicatae 91E135]UPA14151.1 variable large family protein [Borrelia turicatae 91E135]